MTAPMDGNAIVYCEGAFGTTNGKTAHGLVRRTARYRVLSVVDSRHAGEDAGRVLDGRDAGIPVHHNLLAALGGARQAGVEATHLVVGLAPDGGRLPDSVRGDIALALRLGLHVDSGLHDFLGDDPEFAAIAAASGVRIRDIRKTPDRKDLHAFTGCIEEVGSYQIALLGTDSAVGKRTTAWLLVDALRAAGYTAELIGTGQTAWLQGAPYGIILDSLINDFVAGEIEHAIWRAWTEARPEVLVLEGQGSLLNPAYPGGHELLAAGRPDVVLMQHAPDRVDYDGFPGHAMHPLDVQIRAVELLSGCDVAVIALNHEGLDAAGIAQAEKEIFEWYGVPCVDALVHGGAPLVELLRGRLEEYREEQG